MLVHLSAQNCISQVNIKKLYTICLFLQLKSVQFISNLMFSQKFMLKPNHKVGIYAINVCEDIQELIKRAGGYSLDMLKSNQTSICSLVSSLHSSSFFIPEHLFASPLAFSRSISIFCCLLWLPHGLNVRDVLVCLLWNVFPPHEQKKKCEDGCLQSIANASIKHNLREIDALMLVRSILPGDLDRLLCI